MYVTHTYIPRTGEYGLGNQLFQVASTIGIAKAHNRPWGFLPWHNNKYFKHTLPSLPINDLPQTVVSEKRFDYDSIVLPDNSNAVLSGYLQSWKYFENAKEEVCNAFTIKEEHVLSVENALSPLSIGRTCSISVRRGDYVNLQHIHPLQPEEYWVNAQNVVEQHATVDTYIVFSDDINWCRENINLFNKTGKRVIFFTSGAQILDFTAITLCNANITTNSTFSWWGAYLNRNVDKVVVMPKLWFGPTGPWSGPSNANDLHVEGWFRV